VHARTADDSGTPSSVAGSTTWSRRRPSSSRRPAPRPSRLRLHAPAARLQRALQSARRTGELAVEIPAGALRDRFRRVGRAGAPSRRSTTVRRRACVAGRCVLSASVLLDDCAAHARARRSRRRRRSRAATGRIQNEARDVAAIGMPSTSSHTMPNNIAPTRR
jgi:hypothetical protein